MNRDRAELGANGPITLEDIADRVPPGFNFARFNNWLRVGCIRPKDPAKKSRLLALWAHKSWIESVGGLNGTSMLGSAFDITKIYEIGIVRWGATGRKPCQWILGTENLSELIRKYIKNDTLYNIPIKWVKGTGAILTIGGKNGGGKEDKRGVDGGCAFTL